MAEVQGRERILGLYKGLPPRSKQIIQSLLLGTFDNDNSSPALRMAMSRAYRKFNLKRTELRSQRVCLTISLLQATATEQLPAPQILTAHQIKAVRLIYQGFSNRALSRHFGISENAVKMFLSRIYERVGVNDRLELAIWYHYRRKALEEQ